MPIINTNKTTQENQIGVIVNATELKAGEAS
jgi:hypothetical protein